MLDQSGLGLDSALQELRALVAKDARRRTLEQALKRIELQVAPVPVLGLTSLAPPVRQRRRPAPPAQGDGVGGLVAAAAARRARSDSRATPQRRTGRRFERR